MKFSDSELWNSLLSAEEQSPAFLTALAEQMRERKVTFGDRLHCPYLRPFFLELDDDLRVRRVAETIAKIGERVVEHSIAHPSLMAQAGLSEAEVGLAMIEPGYRTASTASRLDSFLLPDSLMFAEYNAESPAGLGYSETLGEIFATFPAMKKFHEQRPVRTHTIMDWMLSALIASYREWGGTSTRPQVAIVDWREVPTWTEFEIIQTRFLAQGVPTVICDPRDLVFQNGVLTADGVKIDLVYRRVLINDIIAKPDECRALVDAYTARAVCVANTFRCKIPHKKAFFAVLHDERNARLFSEAEREVIRTHIPWTSILAQDNPKLLERVRREREKFVLKPNDEYGGTGVVLGWEQSEPEWDAALMRALADADKVWIVQERIPVRREVFPQFTPQGEVTLKEMLLDFSPYLFRGKLGGYLARLSATGLANVTSGGGQVPVFVVE